MWKRNVLIISVVISLIFGSGAVPSYARWHFRGGNVQDIPRRIKERIDALKENEVYLQFKELKDQYIEIKTAWNDLHSVINDLYDVAHETASKKYVSSLLTSSNKNISLAKEMEGRFYSTNDRSNNTKENRDETLRQLTILNENEFKNTVALSNEISEMAEKMNRQVTEIAKDKSGAGHAANQREGSIELALFMAKNQAAEFDNQAAINEISGDIMDENYYIYAAKAAASMDMNYPKKENSIHLEKAKENRLTSLPR